MTDESRTTVSTDQVGESLWWEYARMVLLATAASSSIYWSIKLGSTQTAVWLLLGNLAVLSAIGTEFLAGWPRLIVAVCAGAMVIVCQGPIGSWFEPIPFFSAGALLLCLAAVVLRDLSFVADQSKLRLSLRSLIGLLFVAALSGYMIFIPGIAAFLQTLNERPASYTIENLTALEILRIRTAKLAVFLIFAYAGACWGSFLNVVADSLPRGGGIAFRSSACPRCGTKLRRIDNLPIFSYLNLGGRCRGCDAEIPVRYLVVELIAAGIFSALFFYELITGAANVPEFPHYHYTGILWIILYTKWPVVGIYLFHAGLMCVLLTLTLMEVDRQRCPTRMAFIVLVTFAALPIAMPNLLPIRFDEHLPVELSSSLPMLLARVIAACAGAAAGWLLSVVLRRFAFYRRSRNLTWGCLITGVVLGWQATATIGVLMVACSLLVALRPAWRLTVRRYGATAVLLIVVSLHHPAWEWIDRLW